MEAPSPQEGSLWRGPLSCTVVPRPEEGLGFWTWPPPCAYLVPTPMDILSILPSLSALTLKTDRPALLSAL